MRMILLAAASLSIFAAAGARSSSSYAQAPPGKGAGDWMVYGRVVGIIPLDSSSSTTIGGKITTSPAVTPGLGFSYHFTDHIAVELTPALARHYVRATGTALGGVKVGSTWVFAPAATLQYHFLPKERFNPYLGAGLGYAIFFDSKAAAGLGDLKLSNNVAYVLQAGMDYALTDRLYLNADVRHVFVSTKAKALGGAVRSKTSPNPVTLGVGIGYRF